MGWKTRDLNTITHTVKRRMTCLGCKTRFNRQMTFTGTAQPGQPRTEVRDALITQAREWDPSPLCTPCVDERLNGEPLVAW